MPNVRIVEAIALKSKTYTLSFLRFKLDPLDPRKQEVEEGPTSSHSCAKGVITAVKEKELRTELFRNCITGMREVNVTQRQIRSFDHVNKMIESKKVAFSSFDDKRFLLCAIHSVPYGSCLLKSRKDGECLLCKYPDTLF